MADTRDLSDVNGTPFGVGVDENTALVVTTDLAAGQTSAEVIGENGVYFVDVSKAQAGEQNG